MFLRCSAVMPYLKSADSMIRHGHGRQLLSRPIRISRMYCTAENKDVGLPKTSSAGQTSKPFARLTDHHVNKFEKFLLVWAGKYKSMAEVPNLVSQATLENARNKARIKINISMGVATLIGCVIMIMSGKKAHKEGDSLTKQTEEWHKSLREEYKLKEAAEMAKTAK